MAAATHLRRVVRLAATTCATGVSALALGACGGSDAAAPLRATASPGTLAGSQQEVRAVGAPFTYRLPGDFAAAPAPRGFLAVHGLDPVNLVDLKLVSRRELTPADIVARFGARAGAGGRLELTEQTTVAGRPGVRFDAVHMAAGEELRSELWLFALGGKTWQLECQSDAAKRDRIAGACLAARSSLQEITNKEESG